MFVETGVGTQFVDTALSDKNRLYYNPEKGTFRGEIQVSKSKTYDIVQVRSLKKN